MSSEFSSGKHIDASGKDILLVDDDKVCLTVAKEMLKATNARVGACKSGADCLKIMMKRHFDVVLLDHMMPEMDGIETLKQAKALETDYEMNTVFIALTSNTAEGAREMYLSNGFDDYVAKPVSAELLEETLARYI